MTAQAHQPEGPTRLGPYRVLTRLGKGGMGVVHLAEHSETGRRVALKTVGVPHPGRMATLRREIRALAALRHPGVVRILDEGVEGGLPWYAMELVEGVTIREYCWERWSPKVARETARSRGEGERVEVPPSALRRVLTIFHRLANVLAYVHGEGIVHGDLKPANVLVREGGRPVLVDFGLAAHTGGADGRERVEAMASGGTLAFMAPEQLRRRLFDARADLYALGSLMYYVLTGALPFTTSGELTDPEIYAPSLARYLRAAPIELDQLLGRLLEKDPRRRLGHAAYVAERLVKLGAEREAGPRRPPRAYLYRPAFTGRRDIMKKFTLWIERCRRGEGAVLLVEGEPGVGKSRLLIEVGRLAHFGRLRVLAGECHPIAVDEAPVPAIDPSPLRPLSRPFDGIADRLRARPPGPEAPTWNAVAAVAPYHTGMAALLRDWLRRHRRPLAFDLGPAAGAIALLTAMARIQPILLVLDDLHWADPVTLDVLRRLVAERVCRDLPLLVVAATRRDRALEYITPLTALPGLYRLELPRLGPFSVATMVKDMLGLRRAPPRFVSFLARESEGNPFFVTEYLRAAVARGLLYRDEQGYWRVLGGSDTVEVPYEDLDLPATVRELIRQRLDALSPRARELVDVVAVFGRRIHILHLFDVTRQSHGEILEAVTEILRRDLMEETDEGELRFTHDKTREVAYAALEPGRRRHLHQAAAEAMESWLKARDRLTSLPGTPAEEGAAAEPGIDGAVIGYHWEAAGDRVRALRTYRDHAHRAYARGAFVASATMLQRTSPLLDVAEEEDLVELLHLMEKVFPAVMGLGAPPPVVESIARGPRAGSPRVQAALTRLLGRLGIEA